MTPSPPPPAPTPDKPAAPETGRRYTAVQFEHSPNFPGLLEQLGISLLVSTYQAGQLLAVGTWRGGVSISFHNFEQAMGVAVHPDRLAVGTRRQIWLLRSTPDLAARIEPAGKFDACFLTRLAHYTGPIHGHEMAWADDELWVVNTLFSCLCTLHGEFSFVPRWKPPFISRLAGEDRCHLNGMTLVNGEPKYVSALAECDTAAGWRPTKAKSGCIIDVDSGAVVVRGFAMPHSPRLHEGRLWVLDSGRGQFNWVDIKAGRSEPVIELPGYTRGMVMYGPFAFIGMSRIRETSVFGGIPIAENRERLRCGLSVVDTRSGQLVASLTFKSGVEEIFAVEVLPGVRCPALSGPLPEVDDTQTIWYVPPLSAAPPLAEGEGEGRLSASQPQLSDAAGRETYGPGQGGRPRFTLSTPPGQGEEMVQGAIGAVPALSSLPTLLVNEATNERGIELAREGRLDEAAAVFRSALAARPDQAAAWSNLGNVLKAQGRSEEAAQAFAEAIAREPGDFVAPTNLAGLLREMGRPAEALVQFERARALQPDHPQVLRGLGEALRDLRRSDEAASVFTDWVSRHPADIDARVELAQALQDQLRLDEAGATLTEVLEQQPSAAVAHNCLGIIRHLQGRFPDALTEFNETLRLRPEWAEAHANRALTRLLTGDWLPGWDDCEWRWKRRGWPEPPHGMPMWDGSDLAGKRILLESEQGLGDTLMLIRFADLLRQQGATVLLRCPTVLHPLVRTHAALDRVLAPQDEAHDCQTWTWLLSVPHRLHLTPQTVPAAVPYLHADPALVASWGEKLKAYPGLKVGLVWRGGPSSPYDRLRSIPLRHFRPLTEVPGVSLFSLQHSSRGRPPEDRDQAPLIDLGPDLDVTSGPFMDTAAIMKNLDLVISADTSAVHVAGALGVPVWVVLPFVPDWRWLTDRLDSPWYPQARLFRQPRWDAWDDVIQQVKEALQQRAGGG